MKRITLAAAVALLLIGCAEQVQDAPRAGDDIRVEAFTWRVRSHEQIAAEYVSAGKDPGPRQYVDAYIGTLNGETIITTKAPRYVNDAVACSLGHEVMHAALGDYHVKREAR